MSEAELRGAFAVCGTITECRICCDMHSFLRFAFIEFSDIIAAARAISMSGVVLGGSPIRVSPSKTAISPVSSVYLCDAGRAVWIECLLRCLVQVAV